MKIYVKQIDNTKRELDISKEWTVSYLKRHIEQTLGIPFEQQRLIHRGYPLVNEQSIESVAENDIIHLLIQMINDT